MRKSIVIALAALLFSPMALAQDSVDAHGFYAAPTDGDLLDPLSLYRAERHEQHSVGIQGLFEYTREPLVLRSSTNGVMTEEVLMQDLTALNLGAFYAPHERISLGVSTPLYLSVDGTGAQTGLGLGDVRASGSVGLLLQDTEDVSVGVSVVPYLDIPGFYSESDLGLEGVAGGGLVAVSLGDSTWDITGNAGVEFAPSVEFYNLTGGERLVTGLSASYAFDESVALRAEGTFRPTLSQNDYAWTDSPLETALSLRGYSGDHLGWTVGAAKGISRGVSSADWRVFAGLNLAIGARDTSEVVCADCGPGYNRLHVAVVNPDGTTADADIFIQDRYYGFPLASGDSVDLLEGDEYLLTVVVEPVRVEGDVIYLSMPVFFDFDESELRYPEGPVALQLLADALTAYPEAGVIIHGHTDERGGESYNTGLSERRAQTVHDFLVNELGVDPERLSQIGWGEDWSYHTCGEDEDCHQIDRRVDFFIGE
jgi:outer membrane protein OmpA-like peptidoglycan-associated protein